jgi:hypothetical protein
MKLGQLISRNVFPKHSPEYLKAGQIWKTNLCTVFPLLFGIKEHFVCRLFLRCDDYGWKIEIDEMRSRLVIFLTRVRLHSAAFATSIYSYCSHSPAFSKAPSAARTQKRDARRFQEFNRVLIKHTQIYKYSS